MSKKTRGRMLNRDIADSKKLAKLSPDSLILFFFLVPFMDTWGKMNGNPYFIKGEILKRHDKFTIPKIEKCLLEISNVTNVKWFEHDGIHCIHSINWEAHQKLPLNKRGADVLPSYTGELQSNSRVTPELVIDNPNSNLSSNSNSKSKAKTVSEKCIQQMEEKYPDDDIQKNLEAFCNYLPNRKPAYTDLDSAFRNCMLKGWYDFKKPNAGRHQELLT